MVPEPVLRAARRLDGLTAREGTSGPVADRLRRAAEQLRIVCEGNVGAEAEMAALRWALAELDAALLLIRKSTNSADLDLEEGTGRVRRRIERLVRPVEPRSREREHAPEPPPWSEPQAPPAWSPPPPGEAQSSPDAQSPHEREAHPIVIPFQQLVEVGHPSVGAPALEPSPPSPPERWGERPGAAAPQPAPSPASELAGSLPVSSHEASPFSLLLIGDTTKAEDVGAAYRAKLERIYRRRSYLLTDPLTSHSQLADIDAELLSLLRALRWFAGATASDAADEGPSSGPDAFVFACFLLGSGISAEDLLRRTAPLQDLSVAAAAARLLALRLTSSDDDLPGMELLLAEEDAPAALRAVILSLLADRGRLAVPPLLRFLDHESNVLTVRAAELLVWVDGDRASRNIVEERALRPTIEDRRNALLFAAVALGSEAALFEARRCLDQSPSPSTHLIDTLAIAGNADDAHRLISAAQRIEDESIRSRALLAAIHLGPSSLVAFLDNVPLSDGMRSRAAVVVGEGSRGSDPSPRRLLRGQPWTVRGALDGLANRDEPVLVRQWCALEAFSRGAAHPIAAYDATAPAAMQERTAERIRQARSSRDELPAGRWFYFGRPAR